MKFAPMEHPILLTTLNAKYIHLNLAIRLLYDLNSEQDKIDWKEFTIKSDFDEVARFCSKYEVVCFSCYIWNITQTLEVCTKIKALNPTTKILLGGPEVSYEFDEIIARNDVDYIIVGEGEIPFEQFVEHYPQVENVPNLVYKLHNEVKFNKAHLQFDINLLENRNPYQYDDPKNLKHKVCYIETSRGCPYKCEFCLASLDNKVRYLPMHTIKSNLLYLMQHGKTIKFLDRTFNVKKAFTLELFQFILDHHRPENVFQFEITADIVHPEIIDFINQKVPKGLFRFEIGIQTVNQASNLEVSRKQNFEKTAHVIRQLQDKIEMHLDLIVGLPLEYMSDLKYSFEETFKLFPPELQLGFLKFLKGTPVRKKYENYGYEFDPNPPYQIIKSDFLSKKELDDISKLEVALEVYWNKPRAVNTLTYIALHHSIFDFLMGLGQYFTQKYHEHKHSLAQIYDALFDYISTFDDPVLHNMTVIDYAIFPKTIPSSIQGMMLSKVEVKRLVSEYRLDKNFRYHAIPIDFDWNYWKESKRIRREKNLMIVKYDGRTQAEFGCIKQFKTSFLYSESL
ncbi:B12-binding domain-containing radical SAM protein [Vaginella massiliensis]|uniref:B12-binding domain-containing radical SAM protein n=1 Tax=Vaginella massiliensis TaxID=1816680 RepID=UPI000A8E9B80|nr:DUF4080 domain-containing protein [Vaginella massiliensis]